MKQVLFWFGAISVALLGGATVHAQVERVWLSHRTSDPARLVVSWTTKTPGDSQVRYGPTKEYGQHVHVPGQRTLHHVEIPLTQRDGLYHYSVSTGTQTSADAVFRAYPTDVLRVAVVANWQAKPDLKALRKDAPHLLLTAGDNIPNLWHANGVGNPAGIRPYAALIDTYPELFRSVPFLPALGNHDREIRPRGKKPPAQPVYDIDATAFRTFFELPDEEWKWHFDIPEFQVRFLALDLNHIQDRGTTWQTCHDFHAGSEQYLWYRKLMTNRPPGFVVTLYNERNATMRAQEKGSWHKLFRRGTLVISGFGYYAERAESDGLTYLNTSLSGRGDRYPDPASKWLRSADNYVLLTFHKAVGTMTVEMKSLTGEVLDRQQYQSKPGAAGGNSDPASDSTQRIQGPLLKKHSRQPRP